MFSRQRRTVFGEAADAYDRLRPSYPTELVDDVSALAAPGPVLEVGAGTGKATRLFARPGVDLTCIEPDERMAAVLRRNVPGARVVVTSFEDWQPDQGYGLLYSAQAWHWVDVDRRADLAWAALAPGGLFAAFWNAFLVADHALHAALAEADARHDLTGQTSHRLPFTGRADPDWSELRLDAYTGRQTRTYESTMDYTGARYRDYLLTTSLYRVLDPAAATAALDDAVAVIEEHGGTITFQVRTDVALARRPG